MTAVRDSRYVFAGPGSPSYALRKWQGTVVPACLPRSSSHGGCVVFASAAALTLGIATVPVYEIYKCGEDPHWLEGLDVTSAVGIRAAIIPHYDNNEGGTHDTRFCYLGERRLSIMEKDLPEGAFVLGVDEHTACTFDIEAGTASVEGRGRGDRARRRPFGDFAEWRGTSRSPGYSRPPRSCPRGRGPKRGHRSPEQRVEDRRRQSSGATGAASTSPLVDSYESVRRCSLRRSRLGTWHWPPVRARSGARRDRMVNGHPGRRRARPGACQPALAHLGARPAVRGRRPRSSAGRRAVRGSALGDAGRGKTGPSLRRGRLRAGPTRRVRDRSAAILPTAASGCSRAGAPPGWRPAPDIFAVRSVGSASGRAPIVQRPRTSPFQGGNTGSNPVGGAQGRTAGGAPTPPWTGSAFPPVLPPPSPDNRGRCPRARSCHVPVERAFDRGTPQAASRTLS